jgi:HAMP domain-containing protein
MAATAKDPHLQETPMRSALRIRIPFGSKLFLSHLLAVFLVSGSVGTFFYVKAMESLMHSLRARLQNSAALLSQGIDARELDDIRTPTDMDREAYRRHLATLRRMRRSNPDIAFLYVMRKEGQRIVFVLDSDETDRQAPPGRQYTDAPAGLRSGFHAPSVDDALVRDEWGVFLSGYAPLADGGDRYLIGIDMRADEVDQNLFQLRMTGAMSLLASVLLALIFGLYFSKGLTRRIHPLMRRCRQIAAGRYDEPIAQRTYDEFDDLVEAFDTMGADLGRAHAQAAEAFVELRRARDTLEDGVRERTRELEDALAKVSVLRGLLPICSACKKVRDDQGYWHQVEQFVSRHSGARFSHGLCPACAIELYGDLFTESQAKPSGAGGQATE